MKKTGLTAEECREHEDSIIRFAQILCDEFDSPRIGSDFEQVMLLVEKIKLEGYKEAGYDLFGKAKK